MGKIVQVNPQFSAVALPPSNLPFKAGQTTTLTDAEYAALPAATTRALTVTQSGVPDPVRTATSSPQSLSEALTKAQAYTDARFKGGANGRVGEAVLVAGTVTVANNSVTANTLIFLSRRVAGGTVGNLAYSRVAGTSFTITSSSATETSTVSYLLVEPS
jgi:hypothetical protein